MRKRCDCRCQCLGTAQFLDTGQQGCQADFILIIKMRQDRIPCCGVFQFRQADRSRCDHISFTVGQSCDQRRCRFRTVKIGQRLRRLFADTCIAV